MMINKHSIRQAVTTAAILFVMFFSTAVSATVIQADDAIYGTDAVIHDVDNNRDFLRLDFTVPYNGYDDVVSELGVGGDFDGWLVATLADMDSLGVSAGITHGSTDPTVIAKAEQLRDWFCFTCVKLSSTHEYARGLIADTVDITTNPGIEQVAFSIGRRFNVEPNEADFRPSGWANGDWPDENVYLVRNSVADVPEPTTLALLTLGLAVTGLRRQRNKK